MKDHEEREKRWIRSDRFDAKQESEHAERLAKEARARATALKKFAADMSAANEAATHVVPAAPSVGAAVEAAMERAA